MATVSGSLEFQIPLTADQRKLVGAAASLAGQPVAVFAASAVLETARREVDGRRGIRLSNRDRDCFLAPLDDPPQPGPRLTRAAQQHGEHIVR
jgi:uncharacterized protein (DUF1778 family)